MKVVRWVLGFVVGAYGLYNLLTILSDALLKIGMWRGADVGQRPLIQATAWWQLAVWTLISGAVLAAAGRLMRGRHAFGLAGAAFAADGVLWWVMHAMPAYQQAFTESELSADYATFMGMLAALVAIWLVERPGGRAQPA